ncbi:MAG: phospholipid carrier-dependent glycosyltransferase [Candidatus Nanopelagicales bacterium]
MPAESVVLDPPVVPPSATSPAATRATRSLHRPMSHGLRGWIGPLLVTVLAGVLRFVHLGRPDAIIFDETYYIKDALALLRFGYEREAIDGANDLILARDAPWDQLDIFKDTPAFVVHPPLGKWVIATGEWAFGMAPFGWRFGVAVLGTLSVLMTARILRRLTRSDTVGTIAGLLVALDGLHLVMSRTALLDISLMFFVLAAFGLLLLDRDAVRRRADAWATLWADNPVIHGPGFGLRPWRLAAGVALGLACGVKWSGLWFVAFFGVLTVLWDVALRRELGARHPIRGMLRRDALPAFASIVGVGLLTYVATWSGWLLSEGGYNRDWAATHPGLPFVPDALRSLAEYHRAAWMFHVGLDSPHSYRSSAWSWPVMSRPTSFHYESPAGTCGADRCSEEVLALGNPIIWWAGLLALVHNAWRAVAGRDWRSAALLVAWSAGWLPWLVFHDRTIFTFYAVVQVPFLAGMLAMSMASLAGGPDASPARRQWGLIGVAVFLLVVLIATWFFLPIWTGQSLPYDQWRWRMWLPTWV